MKKTRRRWGYGEGEDREGRGKERTMFAGKSKVFKHKARTGLPLGPAPFVTFLCGPMGSPFRLVNGTVEGTVCVLRVFVSATQANSVPGAEPLSHQRYRKTNNKTTELLERGLSFSVYKRSLKHLPFQLSVCWRSPLSPALTVGGENVGDSLPPTPPACVCFHPDESPETRHCLSWTEHGK